MPSAESIERLASKGYSPPDVCRLLGIGGSLSGPFADAYSRGATQWANDGMKEPANAMEVIVTAVRNRLDTLGGESDAKSIAADTGYFITDVVKALEILFDSGELELFTNEGDEVNVSAVMNQAAPHQAQGAASAVSNGHAKRDPRTKLIDPKALEDCTAEGMSMQQAASALGVSLQTLYKRRDEDPVIREAIERGRNRARESGKSPHTVRAQQPRAPISDSTALLAQTRDQLFNRIKELTAQRDAIDREIVSSQEAHTALVKLLNRHS